VLRDLFLDGPGRFQDLQESLIGASPNTLSARLKKLEEHGLIARVGRQAGTGSLIRVFRRVQSLLSEPISA
jgi:DNA-binding HxlR family transcriptional regulator